MKKIFIAGIVLMTVPFVSFAQTTTTGASSVAVTSSSTVAIDPGFIPGDFFYFLDNLGENLRITFTFNKEKKAKLHLEYANERVAEIDAVLKKPNAKIEDVASAKANFNVQVADAANIIKSEKEKGVDVSSLALELSNELDNSRGELKQALHDYQGSTSKAEAVIRAKIAELTAGGTATSTNDGKLKGLTQALESITKEKNHAIEEESSVDGSILEDETTFDEAMGSQKAAEKHMEKAREIQAHLDEVSSQFGNISTSSEKLMRDAQAAIQRGDYNSAKNISKEAERALEKANEKQGDSEIRMNVSTSINADGSSSSIEGGVDTEGMNNLEEEIKKTENALDGLNR